MSRPLLGFPRRRCREKDATPPQRRREAQVPLRPPRRHGLRFHSVCSDSPEAGARTTSLQKARAQPRLSAGSLLVKWVCSYGPFLCPLATVSSYYQKAFNLGRLSLFRSFHCKAEAFFLFWFVCAHWRLRPAGFSVIQSMI